MHLMGHSRTILAFGYFAVAAACGWMAWRERRGTFRPVYPALWLALAGVLLVMGAQEATRLPGLLTHAVRLKAAAGGWYWRRGDLQHLVMVAAPVVAGAAALGLLWLLRRAWRRYLPAVAALACLIVLGLIESASAHYTDRLLHERVFRLSLKAWADLTGIGLALAAVGWALAWDSHSRRGVNSRDQHPC